MYPRLKILRESLGMTQEDFGKSLGVAKSTYNNYEIGIREPKSDFWIAVATKYHVTIDYLMGFSNDPRKIHDVEKTAPLYSSEALKLAVDYDGLDKHGKKVVRLVADEEKTRMAEIDQKQNVEAAAEIAPEVIYVVPRYLHAMSAGYGEPVTGVESEDMELRRKPPRGTSYIAPVSGDSMEPTYQDGDLLFIRAQEQIGPGQIGVFFMDGQQWVKELGDGVLLSHNPEYEPRLMTDDIRCQGLVLGVCDESYFE